MTRRCGRRFLAGLFLAGVVVLVGRPDGLSPAWAQDAGAVDGVARAKEAARDWALKLLNSFPQSVLNASKRDKRITFQPMDPREVILGSRQRQLVHGWMLNAVRQAGRSGFFTFGDPREDVAVLRALENVGVENGFELYQAALKKHRTRINLSCKSTPEARQIRLECTAKDMTTLETLGSASVRFNRDWLSAPLDLDQALEAIARHVVKGLRGDLGDVSIVDQRRRRESPLTKYMAETLANRVVGLQAAIPRSSSVGGEAPQGAVYDLKGKLVFLKDKVELQVMVYSDSRRVNAVREYCTLGSVASVERGLDPDRGREPGHVFRDCEVCPEMVVIPPGEYMMGSPVGEKGRGVDEGPGHRVRIGETLAVGRYEVTRQEFGIFGEETGRKPAGGCWVGDGSLTKWRQDAGRSWRMPGFSQGERHPVVCVNWEDAQAYAKWLSTKTGKAYRLLSEAEWEYAARAGTTTSRYWGDGRTGQCLHTNAADAAFGDQYRSRPPRSVSCRDGSAHTAAVGSHRANAYRLSDMPGNVWEWVEDCLHEDYSGAPDDGKAWVAGGDCGKRMLRGGSWYSNPGLLRSATRGSDAPENRNFDSGFRVARTLAP